MSSLLDPRTPLRGEAIQTTHTPRRRKHYGDYKVCARKDFEFRCAYCVFHEGDFLDDSGLGPTAVGPFHLDHFQPNPDPDAPERNDYSGLRYACPWCNLAKGGVLGVEPGTGAIFLDPCKVPWSEHFRIEDDELVPAANDADAKYTAHELFFHDPRRKTKRLDRVLELEMAEIATQENPQRIQQLKARSRELSEDGSPDALVTLVTVERELRKLDLELTRARKTHRRWSKVPANVPTECLCPTRKVL